MNLFTHMQQSAQDQYVALVSYSKKRYGKESIIAVAMIILMILGYFGFAWYKKQQNIAAFAGLVEISKSYEQALAKAREQESLPADAQKENPWEDTQLLLEALSSASSGSSLSPFFVIYQAQMALDAERDYDKACQLMEKAVRRMSKNSPYFDMFNVKRIKMLLDSPMQDVRNAAMQELQRIADYKENYYAQEALWTVGAYQAHHGNMLAAIEAWTKLAQEDDSEKALITSPWVSQAQEKLKTLSITLPTKN